MQFISCHNGKLQTLGASEALSGFSGMVGGLKNASDRAFTTGLAALDALAPRQSFARGAVHELLFDAADGQPRFVAAMVAGAATTTDLFPFPGTPGKGPGRGANDAGQPGSDFLRQAWANDRFTDSPRTSPLSPSLSPTYRGEGWGEGVIPTIWSDPSGELYPPALADLGFDLSRTFILRTASDADEAWAVAECLRCRGVGAVIAAPPTLSRIAARRLQLAAERGGSVGILLRQTGRGDSIYAAATRWKVSPMPGERTVQRWTIRLLHGHGGRVNQTVILEWDRENHSVRAIEKLADRPAATTTAAQRASA